MAEIIELVGACEHRNGDCIDNYNELMKIIDESTDIPDDIWRYAILSLNIHVMEWLMSPSLAGRVTPCSSLHIENFDEVIINQMCVNAESNCPWCRKIITWMCLNYKVFYSSSEEFVKKCLVPFVGRCQRSDTTDIIEGTGLDITTPP